MDIGRRLRRQGAFLPHPNIFIEETNACERPYLRHVSSARIVRGSAGTRIRTYRRAAETYYYCIHTRYSTVTLIIKYYVV